jgi:hypothetical protein
MLGRGIFEVNVDIPAKHLIEGAGAEGDLNLR